MVALSNESLAPYARRTQTPVAVDDFTRQQIAKQQRSNFHSTSLTRSLSSMVSTTVNKTALHPSGVQYVRDCSAEWTLVQSVSVKLMIGLARPQKDHTEIEEELHESAHIDYDRVAIVSDKLSECFAIVILIMKTGSESVSSCPLRRCPCVRNRIGYYSIRCAFSLLRSEDWTFAVW